jgi:hypothetical protein
MPPVATDLAWGNAATAPISIAKIMITTAAVRAGKRFMKCSCLLYQRRNALDLEGLPTPTIIVTADNVFSIARHPGNAMVAVSTIFAGFVTCSFV